MEKLLGKISTWSHSHQVNIDKWYRWKWLASEPETKNLGVIGYIDIRRAVRYNGPLPAEVKSLPSLKQQFVKLSIVEKFLRWLNDMKYFVLLIIKWPYYLIRYRINLL